MATHRYWRATAFEAYAAGDLELSEFHLLATATRVDASATLTASVAPTTGTVSNLQDDALATAASWARLSLSALTLNWDFGGSPVDVTDIRMAGNTLAKFPLIVKMQWSDDSTSWTDLAIYSGITYPGIATKTSSSSGVIITNLVKGRASPLDMLVTISSGTVMVYGTPVVIEPLLLTVQSGSVKDYASGVLGTGRGRVRGTVKVKNSPSNTPVYRKVRLIRERDGVQMRELWSDPVTGAYDFQYIDELQTWIVMSLDYLHTYVPTIADNLVLANGVEMMP